MRVVSVCMGGTDPGGFSIAASLGAEDGATVVLSDALTAPQSARDRIRALFEDSSALKVCGSRGERRACGGGGEREGGKEGERERRDKREE